MTDSTQGAARPTGLVLRTADGYTFHQLTGGVLVDQLDPAARDMSYDSLEQFLAATQGAFQVVSQPHWLASVQPGDALIQLATGRAAIESEMLSFFVGHGREAGSVVVSERPIWESALHLRRGGNAWQPVSIMPAAYLGAPADFAERNQALTQEALAAVLAMAEPSADGDVDPL